MHLAEEAAILFSYPSPSSEILRSTLMAIFSAFFLFFRSLFVSRISLATEILVLRQQLLILNRAVKRPKLRRRDRLFWVCLSRLWKDWRDALIIVKPDTVIKWHREGFRLYWRWKSKAPIGRPAIDKEIRELIRRISRENPLWGAPRIQSELRLLGLNGDLAAVRLGASGSYLSRIVARTRSSWISVRPSPLLAVSRCQIFSFS